jgi:hypothetical protein
MNASIKRQQFRSDGIFGVMSNEQGNVFCVTLEHAYQDPLSGLWVPKVAAAVYTCVRHPPNRLPYETFMLYNVPNFQNQSVDGILLHVLNFNRESQGCIGLGQEVADIGSEEMITHSQNTFDAFMALQIGVDSFQLTIS